MLGGGGPPLATERLLCSVGKSLGEDHNTRVFAFYLQVVTFAQRTLSIKRRKDLLPLTFPLSFEFQFFEAVTLIMFAWI